MKDRVFELTDIVRETGYAIHCYHGPGHLEKVYENALVHRLRKGGLSVEQQKPLTVYDEDGTVIGEYVADIVVEGQLVLEVKAAKAIVDDHVAQTLGYLRSARVEHGAIVNFGAPKFQVRKLAMSEALHQPECNGLPPLLALLFSLFFVFFGYSSVCSAAEVLCNGIVLPEAWPPEVREEDVRARKPLAEPPYLVHPPAVIPIDVGRQLFVDDFLIEQTTLKRTYHLATYHPANPVFTGGMPFSGGVFWDPHDQLIKMWYHHGGGTGYTTSKDGIHWEPGRLVLEGNTDSQCVWLDLEEKDPARRYKMTRSVVADNRCRGWIYYSADGIDWRQVGYTGDWGDRSTFFWDPFRKLWVMSCRHGWGQPRARRYWEVRDMEKGPYWRAPGQPAYAPFWIGSDTLDPARPDYRIDPQLYNLDAVGYESLMLGLFTIWRGQPGPREKPNEVCLGFSRDGFHWTRPDRRAFCPVSETAGAWNYANVQSAAGGCLVMGDQLYFYVSARGNGRVAGLATLRRDGFASMDADASGGTLTTRLVTFRGKHAFVNLDAPQGELRVEILDEKGDPIPPFRRDNCVPVRGDYTLAPVRWSGESDLSAAAGKKVRLRFYLTRGSFYAFWVSPDDSGASYGYVAAGGPGFPSNLDTVGRRTANP